jgi:hypothetical protein
MGALARIAVQGGRTAVVTAGKTPEGLQVPRIASNAFFMPAGS